MNNKIVNIVKKADIPMLVSYVIAIAVIGAAIYYVPQGFIGLVIGLALGINKDKIENLINDEEDDI